MAKFFWNFVHGRGHAVKTSLPERLCLIEDALKIQNTLFERKRTGDEYNFLIFAEHDNVYAITPTDYRKMEKLDDETKLFRPKPDPPPAHIYTLPENRGGSITYHGPGQLVCYMILDLDELGVSPFGLNKIIEETLIEALMRFNINAHKKPADLPNAASGVWVTTKDGTQKKIASRGVWAVRKQEQEKRITKYGFALNVFTDLSYFDYIYPCGLDIQMTSILELTGEVHPIHTVASIVAEILIRKLEKAS